MGLDMYAFKMKAKEAGDIQTMDSWSDDIERVEMAYWRKFNHLHGWMEALYTEKGGDKLDFNCVYVRLEQPDLDRLKMALDNKQLTHTPGFFFGGDEMHEWDVEATEKFIEDAKQALLDGDAVFYYSWW
jgi:hypothetical protein